MNAVRSIPSTGLSLDALQTYASRLVRFWMLQKFCHDNHPVLKIEEKLVNSAKVSLQSQLGSHFTHIEIIKIKFTLIRVIKTIAANKIASLDEDDLLKSDLLRTLNASSFDDLIPSIHPR
jgi:hypothetical protein